MLIICGGLQVMRDQTIRKVYNERMLIDDEMKNLIRDYHLEDFEIYERRKNETE
jgi:PP-loop superfamily ATP-utilizing enzyme